MFTERDLAQFSKKGIGVARINRQLHHFETGFPFIRLLRPATAGDGIFSFSPGEVEHFRSYYHRRRDAVKVLKFVPASGAATRMFKHLFEFLDSRSKGTVDLLQILSDQSFQSVGYLLAHLQEIAFYRRLEEIIRVSGLDTSGLLQAGRPEILIRGILDEQGLGYASLPKGLILFHDYPDGARTAAEEHLVEAAAYTRNSVGNASIHFTISPEHRETFDLLFNRVQGKYEDKLGVSLEIGYSEQEAFTDTIAVDPENNPFRTADGTILFRPGGHGALLTNLNRLDADLIFVKNIDNLVPDRLKPTTILYKEVIGGYLLSIRDRINAFLQSATQGPLPEEQIGEMVRFTGNELFFRFSDDFALLPPSVRQQELIYRLNRPIRVCGMVKNEGEPGGGPFWVQGPDDSASLQIVESSQIDLQSSDQQAIVNRSTHFNPVDLVCCIRDFAGNTFDLSAFVDESTGFISEKSSGGRSLKAQELPGLWNGAMAGWITVFVEVPVITFNPVKTVNDLLRKEHLPEP